MLTSPSQTSYAAATMVSFSGNAFTRGAFIGMLDSNKNLLATCGASSDTISTLGRYEVKISGGTATCFRNNISFATTGALAQNPSYIVFGSKQFDPAGTAVVGWDDYVYGQGENKIVLGLPQSSDNQFFILDDLINNANDGLYNSTSSSQQDANFMQGQWSRGNASLTPEVQPNMSIQLVSYPYNVVYGTNYTGTGMNGAVTVDIKTLLIDANAPDGYYALYVPNTGAYSNQILKKSNGATVAFNADTYSTGDTATVITYVASGGYWDTGTYDYKLALYGLTSGYVQNYTVTMQSGAFTHSWSSTDTPGVYYAIMYATSKTTGTEYILGLDWATLTSFAGYSGYVNDAETNLPVSGVFVNVTQDGTNVNSTSLATGAWNVTGFNTGEILTLNATKTGYQPYNYSWIPLSARTVTNLNITMVSNTPTFTGLAIGGVDRDSLYGIPISGATVTLQNTTTGQIYYKTTSITGWYICDEGSSCILTTKTPYSVWGYKIGYKNSTTYSAVTA